MVVQPDGKVWVSGSFSQGTLFLGRLNPDGSLDSSFNPDPELVFVLLVGLQSGCRAIGWANYNTLRRINQDGSIEADYTETEIAWPLAAVVQPDDKVIVIQEGGNFSTSTITRFNAGGGVDGSFTQVQVDGYGRAMTLQPDGKVLLGGDFSTVNGVSRQGVARLLPNGDLDSSFNPSLATNASIKSFVVQPDGKVIIGGSFSIQGGLLRNNLVRLNADGSLDTSFDPGEVAANEVSALALQTDGKVIIAGTLASADGITRYTLSRLNTDGSIDKNFDPGTGPNGPVYRMAWQGDGKLRIAGRFTEVNGVRRLRIARLNGDPPFKFGPLARTANGPLRLTLTAQPGKNYVLQTSTDFVDWLSLSTNTPIGFNLQFDDADAASFPRRFYRARQLTP